MLSNSQRPFSIRVFIPNGDPDGLRLVEKSNWTGIGIVFNRTVFKEACRREELNRTGVYVLVGDSDDSSLPTLYIGEGDPIRDRLIDHYAKKDFWQSAVCFVTKDNSLNKAHVQQMECGLLKLAKSAKQCKVANANSPTEPTLSEADRADIASFIDDMVSIFPLLGVGVFEKAESRAAPLTLLFLAAKGMKASGFEDPKGFAVKAGSEAVKAETATIHQYMSNLRNDLIEEGVLMDAGDRYRFAHDHFFGSPSTAAGVILGRTANGRVEWRAQDGRTLKDLQIQATEGSATDD